VVRGLDAGADDYLAKPVNPRLLVGRLEALRRRYQAMRISSSNLVVRIGERQLDFESQRVWWPPADTCAPQRSVQLTVREYRLLRQLATHAGQVLTYRQLAEHVTGDAQTDDGSFNQARHVARVKAHVKQLRNKLDLPLSGPGAIVAVPGVGYRLMPSAARAMRAASYRRATVGWPSGGADPL
jgi:two-component system KDP operon response regulator KdpE